VMFLNKKRNVGCTFEYLFGKQKKIHNRYELELTRGNPSKVAKNELRHGSNFVSLIFTQATGREPISS